jgi:hypothetical protein
MKVQSLTNIKMWVNRYINIISYKRDYMMQMYHANCVQTPYFLQFCTSSLVSKLKTFHNEATDFNLVFSGKAFK